VSHTGFSEMPDLIKDGHADVMAITGPYPAPVALDLQTSMPITVVSVPDDKIIEFLKRNKGYMKEVIPAGTYEGQKYDANTISTTSVVIVSKDLPEDVVYKITKALFEGRQRLIEAHHRFDFITKENVLAGLEDAYVHPGAMKYYKEIGVR